MNNKCRKTAISSGFSRVLVGVAIQNFSINPVISMVSEQSIGSIYIKIITSQAESKEFGEGLCFSYYITLYGERKLLPLRITFLYKLH